MLLRIIIASVAMLVLMWIPFGEVLWARMLRLGCYLAVYLIIGYDILRKAGKGIYHKQVFDENFLMAIATIGAMIIAIYENGDYTEAIAVMLFYQIGEFFQSYAIGKSRRNIAALMDIRPDTANLLTDNGIEVVEPDDVVTGSIIVVRPGEKIPIDGIVVEGQSTLNTSALTGESLPREVKEGEEVISGCVNLNGVLHIRTTREFEESTVSKILELVENASSRKSRSENFISKFARVYTPIVCYSALALALIPPLVLFMTGNGHGFSTWSDWIYRALIFLVISCPCALVVSLPLSFFAGIGGASKAGVLVKGSNYLESLSNSRYVLLDKTGTLTEGVFEVTGIYHNRDIEKETLLEYAAYAESHSTHPISKSLQRAYGKELDLSKVSDIEEISGNGVLATVEGKRVAIGNEKLMQHIGLSDEIQTQTDALGTIVHMAIDGRYEGYLVISDRMKATAKSAIADLKKVGIRQTIMLTGDSEKVALKVAGELGIDRVYAQLLPADKVEKVEQVLAQKHHDKEMVLFVGDGINDAPVLSRADVGIAMGALGSDAAIEAADIVLMDDNPQKIAKAIRIAQKCMRIVYENIVFAIGVKVICLILGALGIANMWIAIFADVGVMVIAVLNAIRALFVKKD